MHTQTFFHCFFLGLAAAIISVTMIVIMAKEPILNWWFIIGEKYGKRIVNGYELERWFFRPIWGCEKCFAGQIALWSYCFTDDSIRLNGIYFIAHQLLAVCVSILFSVFISSYINKTLNKDDNNI